jgi:hypothetical protein
MVFLADFHELIRITGIKSQIYRSVFRKALLMKVGLFKKISFLLPSLSREPETFRK